MQPDQLLKRLAALARPAPLRLFRRLLRHGRGGLSSQRLMSELGIGGAALSLHLKTLVRAGLIEGGPAPDGTCFRVKPDALRELLDAITAECCAEAGHSCEMGAPAPRPKAAGKAAVPPTKEAPDAAPRPA
jgi:ArsR family transcriptional regulator, arsenate/arsenite/antimonite-responsive transcriptional repressor